ncbi:Papain inhibitor [Paramyrothecium foliicola]|nr:Papain inhibitor [Paramyrothecium foliicola]
MSSLIKVVAAIAVSASSALAFNGDMTWFEPGLGACGWTHNRGNPVVALSPAQFGQHSNPNNAPVCGKWITITANGRTTAAQVVDLCPECVSGAIDVSPAIFDDIANLGVGRIKVDWWFQ